MKLPSERRAAETIASSRDPRESETWFQNLPPDRRDQMIREHRARLQHGLELQIADRRRAWRESACMGGAFLLADVVSPGGTAVTALLSLLLGTGLGYCCNRLDAHQLLTSMLGVCIFLGSQYVLLGGLGVFHVVACLPMGAFFALLGFQREERGTL
jgi:hypothetical protein